MLSNLPDESMIYSNSFFQTAFALGSLLTMRPGTLSAQQITAERPGGFVSAAVSVGRPVFSGRTEQVLSGVGSVGASSGVALRLGWSVSRVAFELGMSAGGLAVNGQQAGTLGFSALAHVGLHCCAAGWRSHGTIGLVRHGIGGLDAQVTQLPVDLQSAFPNVARIEDSGVLGNGVRPGVGGERVISPRLMLTVNGFVDAMHYGSFTFEGSELTLPNAGWSYTPNLSVGVRLFRRVR